MIQLSNTTNQHEKEWRYDITIKQRLDGNCLIPLKHDDAILRFIGIHNSMLRLTYENSIPEMTIIFPYLGIIRLGYGVI